MNVKLLRKVTKHILAEPKRLAMYTWLRHKDYPEEMLDLGFCSRPFAKCGTAGCIAGWTCALNGKADTINFGLVARRILGLTKKQGDRLFLPDQWPEEFERGYCDDGKPKTAQVAVARIEHFIKTKGRE